MRERSFHCRTNHSQLADAVAAVGQLSVQDRIDSSGLNVEERDMVNAVLQHFVLGALLRVCADLDAARLLRRWLGLRFDAGRPGSLRAANG